MVAPRIAIIGAGVGGLSCALRLAGEGCEVAVFEGAGAPGGKMRSINIDGTMIDAGPTVFTMRWVFDDIFAEAGARFEDRINLTPLSMLARHVWEGGEKLDLFADVERSAEAIGNFSGALDAAGFRRFCAKARAIYRALEAPFIRSSRPNPVSLVMRAGLGGLGGLSQISPFATLWGSLVEYFRDPRLRQLFGRYATYCGSSPMSAPATLMLIAHVEMQGVWSIEGGMHRLACSLAELAKSKGARIHLGQPVKSLLTAGGAANGVELGDGERWMADAVVMNGDVEALSRGLFGKAAAGSVAPTPRAARSLSAVTWAMNAKTQGFPLGRHNVFFSNDSGAEFDDLFKRRRIPIAPTVYVCAQDRINGEAALDGAERLLCLINAPADGDAAAEDSREIETCETAAFGLLARCGLEISNWKTSRVRTTPQDFAHLFPATGGALYGRASHGWMASFLRPGSRTRLPGLYLAGGSVHPGPGVPMAALSGRQAAISVLADLASMRRWVPAAIAGGMPMA